MYADDTIILTSNRQAAEIILHKIQEESSRYNMRLNQNKCILLGMNSIGSVQYIDGGLMPTAERAPYVLRDEYVSKREPTFGDERENNKHHNNAKQIGHVLEKGSSLHNLEDESA